MYFNVAFDTKQEMTIKANSMVFDCEIRIPVYKIAGLIHEICDDLDMMQPQDMEILKEAIDRFNYLTKVES